MLPDIDKVTSTLDLDGLNKEQLQRLARIKQAKIRLERDGGIWLYKPKSYVDPDNGKELYQEAFHRSDAKIRWVFGGNRSGKTHSALAEVVWWATGMHPYKKIKVPNHGWVVSLDFNTSFNDAEKKFFELLPASQLAKFDQQRRIAYLHNKSTVQFKSCDQGEEKFQGGALDYIFHNEEPKHAIHKECMRGTIDKKGKIWCAETPTAGMTWTFDEIWELAGIDPDIEVFNYDTLWNVDKGDGRGGIPKEEVEGWMRKMSEDERQMRIHGKFIQLSGLIFKPYNRDVHVIKPFKIPYDWRWCRFRGIDHGLNNPTACLWVAINREGEWYIYDEYYESDKTIPENAYAIKTISAGEKYRWSAIDGSTKSRQATDKQTYYDTYKKHGIICKPVYLNSENVSVAINTVNDLMRINDKTHRPKFFIFDTCYMTIKEISRYRWKTTKTLDDRNPTEKPQDYMNHAITAIFFIILSKARWIPRETDIMPEVKPWYT